MALMAPVRPADDIAEADDVGDAAAVDLGKDGGQSLEIGVNVTNDGEHRYRSLGNNPRLRSENGKKVSIERQIGHGVSRY